jgi:hypothetical protein
VAAAHLTVTQMGCGKPSDDVLDLAGGGSKEVNLKGYAGIGTKCPSGYISTPKALKIDTMYCTAELSGMELAEPLTPVLLSADCDRKTLQILTLDHAIDGTWYMLPSNEFDITFDGLNAKLASDGYGGPGCTVPISTRIWGKVDCGPGRDQAKIRFEAKMWLNSKADHPTEASPTPSPSPTPTPPPTPRPTPTSTPIPLPTPRPTPPSPFPPMPTPHPGPVFPNPTPRPITAMVTLPARVTAAVAPAFDAASPGQCRFPVDQCWFLISSTVNQCQ